MLVSQSTAVFLSLTPVSSAKVVTSLKSCLLQDKVMFLRKNKYLFKHLKRPLAGVATRDRLMRFKSTHFQWFYYELISGEKQVVLFWQSVPLFPTLAKSRVMLLKRTLIFATASYQIICLLSAVRSNVFTLKKKIIIALAYLCLPIV